LTLSSPKPANNKAMQRSGEITIFGSGKSLVAAR